MNAATPPSSPAAAPQAEVKLQAPALWRRMACWLYEAILLFGLVFIADYLFDTLSQSRHGLANRALRMGYLFVVFGIYFGWFWSRGQTLAQKTWHIRVVDARGRALGQPRALLRYLLAWLWFLPPLAAHQLGLPLFSTLALLLLWIVLWALASRLHPQQQFWHDQLAGTRLIHDARPAPARRRP
ncbi:RDD family protein [Comamonas flocculans]|uniref:RDD family protein n=1 Tax=Comamonas flocculans TaxID=2597701 RepID=A0A5B8RQM9_9BURK|nr:RDD family protein [Comamonas flocculans]QEA11930.1 RDD family protein [Comamonas flocculans]